MLAGWNAEVTAPATLAAPRSGTMSTVVRSTTKSDLMGVESMFPR
jgi:hypothetical protein